MTVGSSGKAEGTARVTIAPGGRSVVVSTGALLADALSRITVFDLPCGGRGACGRCAVRVEGPLSPPDELEIERLGERALKAGYRLACRAAIAGDITVALAGPGHAEGKDTPGTVAAASLLCCLPAEEAGQGRATAGGAAAPFRYEPYARVIEAVVEQPSLQSQKDDMSRLRAALEPAGGRRPGSGGLRFALPVLRGIPSALRAAGGHVRATVCDDRVIDLEPGRRADGAGRGPFGVAIDIGTTTLAAYLVDMGNVRPPSPPLTVDALSTTNPQVARGADLVSRITYSSSRDGGVEEMRRLVVEGLNRLVAALAQRAGIAPREVRAAAIVGNTCMSSYFLGVDPQSLGRSPYVAPLLEPAEYTAALLGLDIHPDAGVWVAPGIAGYVGGDTVAVGVVADAIRPGGTWLAVDIGTNGEVLVNNDGRMFACSTAAGPAFEGGQITCGMRALPGAIVDVRFDGDRNPVLKVLGDCAPRGLCGSGLIRAVREMLLASIIDPSGRFRDRSLVETGFNLGEDAAGVPVVLTQKDVRQLQLAKAALRTGVDTAMRKAGLAVDDLDAVYLAGAFGNHIRPDDAVGLGLLPPVDLGIVRPIGNAAGTGAQVFLLSSEARKRAASLASGVEHIELSVTPGFQEAFVGNIEFPAPGACEG